MKLAFLIAAHTHPRLLARLIQRLQSAESSIFVHIDALADLAPFEVAFHDHSISGIHLVPRVRSPWGSFGQVRSTLSLLNEALVEDAKAERFILISGQDYPLMKPEAMAAFLVQDCMTYHPLPWSEWDGNGGLDRLRRFHFLLGRYSFTYPSETIPRSRLTHAAYVGCKVLLPRERSLPSGITLYGGSNWWNLSRNSVASTLDYLHRNSDFARRFRFTKSADEIFFQTVLLNAVADPSVSNDDLRYTIWDGRRGEFPATLRVEDFENIAASGKLFARKMHPEHSLALMDRIDDELLQ
jgi:hypothetical protein